MDIFKTPLSLEEDVIRYLGTCTPEDEIYDVTDDDGNSLLHLYSGNQYATLQDQILRDWPAIVHSENETLQTPIFYAIEYNNLELVKRIIAIDESVISHTDIHGRSPLYVSFSSRCSIEVCEHLFQFPVLGNSMWYYREAANTSFAKSKFLLEKYGILESLEDAVYVLHQTLLIRSPYIKRIVRHIHDTMGGTPFTTVNHHGEVALHYANEHTLKLVYDIFPAAVHQKNIHGNTPLATIISNYSDQPSTTAIDIMRKHPEILSIQNNHGLTLFMLTRCCPREMFDINQSSFLIPDETGDTSLHHICREQPADRDWPTFADDIMKVYPKMLFAKNAAGSTPLDLGIHGPKRNAGKFVANCLKHSAIPDRYWIFSGSNFDLLSSMPFIRRRSVAEASRAFFHLPHKDKEVVQTLVVGLCRFGVDISDILLEKILSKYVYYDDYPLYCYCGK